LRAGRAGEEWILEGEVRGAVLGDRAGLFLVFAAMDSPGGKPAPVGSPDRSAFLVPREARGLTVARTGRTLGLCAAGQARVNLDAVRLPPDALLGSVGEGRSVRAEVLAVARLGLAALSLGIAQAALGHAARYAGEREQFGRVIAEFGGIREKLGGMVLRTDLVREFLLAEGRRWAGIDRGEGGRATPLAGERHEGAALAKVSASEAAMWCTDEAVQIFGGYGYMRDYPVEKL
ncbi:MAG: acyl-CoA dehydrogenase family protein, partial [Gemmatimonadota bacterium]